VVTFTVPALPEEGKKYENNSYKDKFAEHN
jgi:hypothetical protein